MSTTERDIGSLQSDVEAMQRDLGVVKSDIREVRDIMLRAQGGWKMMVTLGTVCAFLGATAAKLLSFIPAVLK